MKAWLGQPADSQGNQVTCEYCDRVAIMCIKNEPRCNWHVTGHLGGAGLNQARASATERKKNKL